MTHILSREVLMVLMGCTLVLGQPSLSLTVPHAIAEFKLSPRDSLFNQQSHVQQGHEESEVPLTSGSGQHTRLQNGYDMHAHVAAPEGLQAAMTNITNYAGDTAGTNKQFGYWWNPPNPSIAVAGGYILSVVDKFMTIRDSSNPARILKGPTPLYQFMQVPSNHKAEIVQPQSLYDAFNDRWFVAALSLDPVSNYVRVMVSRTNDPRGSYYSYVVAGYGCNGAGPCRGDNLRMGQNFDSIWFGFNLFNNNTFETVYLAGCSKERMVAGDPASCATYLNIDLPEEARGSSSWIPSSTQGLSGSGMYFGSVKSGKVVMLKVEGTYGLSSTPNERPYFATVRTLDVGPLPQPSPAIQGDRSVIRTLDNRLQSLNFHDMTRSAEVGSGGYIFATANTDAYFNGKKKVGVAWFVLSTINNPPSTFQVVSQGVFGSSQGDTMFGSLVGFINGGGLFAGLAATTTASYASSVQAIINVDSCPYAVVQTSVFNGSTYLKGGWAGAYATAAVDPASPLTPYFVTTYAQSSNVYGRISNWGTVFTKMAAPGAPPPDNEMYLHPRGCPPEQTCPVPNIPVPTGACGNSSVAVSVYDTLDGGCFWRFGPQGGDGSFFACTTQVFQKDCPAFLGEIYIVYFQQDLSAPPNPQTQSFLEALGLGAITHLGGLTVTYIPRSQDNLYFTDYIAPTFLPSLVSIENRLYIAPGALDSSQFLYINGLPGMASLRQIGTDFFFADTAFATLDSFPSLQCIGGGFALVDMLFLTTLEGLNSLAVVNYQNLYPTPPVIRINNGATIPPAGLAPLARAANCGGPPPALGVEIYPGCQNDPVTLYLWEELCSFIASNAECSSTVPARALTLRG